MAARSPQQFRHWRFYPYSSRRRRHHDFGETDLKGEITFSNKITNMKKLNYLTLLVVAAQLMSAHFIQAQPNVNIKQVPEISPDPQAVVIGVTGKGEYSEDGKTFVPITESQVIKEGSVIKTGEDSRVDIFFRRIGTSVRLQPSTEITLEKMTRVTTNGSTLLKTLLDLKTGRIFTVVRSFVPGSTLEIRNAAGRSVVEGSGNKGRYIITADGTHVTHKDSEIPLKVIGEKGITIIKPGQQFLAKDGKLMDTQTPDAVVSLIEFDEIHALAEKLDKKNRIN